MLWLLALRSALTARRIAHSRRSREIIHGVPTCDTRPARRTSTARGAKQQAGSDVLSHRVAPAVPSARQDFTSEFGMGSGVAPAPWPPAKRKNQGRRREVPYVPERRPNFRMAGQASRAISTARLHVSPRFHLPPINVLVSHGPSEAPRGPGSTHLGGGFPLRCFQRLSLPDVATRRCPWRNSRYTSGQSTPVLSY